MNSSLTDILDQNFHANHDFSKLQKHLFNILHYVLNGMFYSHKRLLHYSHYLFQCEFKLSLFISSVNKHSNLQYPIHT